VALIWINEARGHRLTRCASSHALASRKDIEDAVNWSSHGVNANHLTHAITHGDMINAGRRVKDANGVRHPVVIVDTNKWTIKMVNEATPGRCW
jgi:hypothetical protein